MNTGQLKLHKFKAIITVHEVKIMVKFPCSLIIILKIDNAETQIGQEHKLVDGLARINSSINASIQMKYDPVKKQYYEPKVNLVIYLKSSTGKIPAGSAKLGFQSRRQFSHKLFEIEKCPDKNAKIECTAKLSLISEETISQKSRSPPSQKLSQRNINTESYKQLRASRVSNSRLYTSGLRNEDEKSEKSDSKSQQSRISRMIIKEHENEVNSQRQKIVDLEKQKARALRQIRQLKYQLEANSQRNSSIKEKEEKYLIAQRESRINQLQNEIDGQRRKYQDVQMHSHQQKMKVQELERQIKAAKKKNEQLEEENKIIENQVQNSNTKIREIVKEFRDIKEKYQDLTISHENLLKKFEFKQNAYKEQLNSLNQKYTESENEKQKLLYERNQLINKYELKEKKEIDSVRTRERGIAEEKNKLTKTISMLQKKIEGQKQQIDLLKRSVEESENNYKKVKMSIELKEANINKLNEDCNNIRNQYQREISKCKSLKDQLSQHEKNSQEIKRLKGTVSEKDHIIMTQQKSISNTQNNKKQLQKKIEELDSSIRQKITAYKQLQKQNEALNKKVEMTKKSQHQKQKQLQELTSKKQSNEHKLMGANEDRKNLEKRYIDIENKLKNQIQNLHYQINQLEEDNQQISQKNGMQLERINSLEKQLAQRHKQYQQKIKDISNLQKEFARKQNEQENYRIQILNLSEEIKLNTQISNKQEQNYQESIRKLETRLRELQMSISQGKMNSQYQNKILEDKVRNLENELRLKEKENIQLRRLTDSTQEQTFGLETQLAQASEQLKAKIKQLQYFKTKLEELQRLNTEKEEGLRELEFQIQNLKRQASILANNASEQKEEAEVQKNSVKALQKQFDKYKSNNIYNTRNYLVILAQQQLPQMVNIQHDEKQIVHPMLQTLEKRKRKQGQLKERILSYEEQVNNLRSEAQQLHKQISDTALSIQKLSQSKQISNAENEKMYEELNSLKRQIKERSKENKELNSQIVQLRNSNTLMDQKVEMENKKTEQIIQSLKNENQALIQKVNTEMSIAQTKIDNRNESIQSLNEKISTCETTIKELQTKLLKVEKENEKLTGIIAEKQKLQARINESTRQYKAKIMELQTQRKLSNSQLTNKTKEAEKLLRTVQSLQAACNSLKEQVEAYHYESVQNKNVGQKNLNLEIVIKGQKQRISGLEEKVVESKKIIKELEQQIQTNKRQGTLTGKKQQKQYETEKKIRQALEAKHENLKQSFDEMQAKQKNYKQQISELSKKINALSNESSGDKQKLVKENESIKKKLEGIIKEKDGLNQELKNKIQEISIEKDFYKAETEEMEKQLTTSFEDQATSTNEYRRQNEKLIRQKNTLEEQLKASSEKIRGLHSSLNELSRKFETYQLQNNNNTMYLQPIITKLNKILSDCENYTTFMKGFEPSKNKILKISQNKFNEGYVENIEGEAIRQLNMALQKCKIQILNRFKGSPSQRNMIVEEFKKLQLAIQKIKRR